MKRLIIVRHAKSSWDDDRLADHDRPLAPRGERDAPRIAGRLPRDMRPELIVSSTAKRARKTAQIFALTLDIPSEQIKVDETLYLAGTTDLFAAIARLDESLTRVMLVGHNPGLTELVHTLLPGFAPAELPTCAVLALDFDGRWDGLEAAQRRLRYYDFPKNPGDPLLSD